MKNKKAISTALAVIIGLVAAMPLAAQSYTYDNNGLMSLSAASTGLMQPLNRSDLLISAEQSEQHEKVLQLVRETNAIEEKCNNIFTDVQNIDLQSLTADLDKITLEEFYSERRCMDAIPELLQGVKEGKDMQPLTKAFINKFGHPDNLIVSYMRFGGSFYRMTLLSEWASSEYLASKKIQKKLAEFARFLIEEGADIYEEFSPVAGETTTIKDFIFQHGSESAVELINATQQLPHNQ